MHKALYRKGNIDYMSLVKIEENSPVMKIELIHRYGHTKIEYYLCDWKSNI